MRAILNTRVLFLAFLLLFSQWVSGQNVITTFFGGIASEDCQASALDAQGNLYIAVDVYGTGSPTTIGCYDSTYNGGQTDILIAKFSPDLSQLLASTYLGGSGTEHPTDMIIDATGNIFVVGQTYSGNFPTAGTPFDMSFSGNAQPDGFIAKFNPSLTQLIASTAIGDVNGTENIAGITQDTYGYVYIVGSTNGSSYPTTLGAYSQILSSSDDCIVSKLDGSLTSMLASTYLGGISADIGQYIDIDPQGNVLICGHTYSVDFPVSIGSYDTTHNGSSDGFISKFNSTLTTLIASTLIGGGTQDHAIEISHTLSGNPVVIGFTLSSNFPITPGVIDAVLGGVQDGFVCWLSGDLTQLIESTYIGGQGIESLHGIHVDSNDNVYFTGFTKSSNYPVTSNGFDTTYASSSSLADGIFTILPIGLDSIIYSTFLGGLGVEVGYTISFKDSNTVYVGGMTESSDFPISGVPYDSTYNGLTRDVFLARFSPLGQQAIVTLQPFSDICIDSPPLILTGGQPIGGSYSGLGVSNGIFNPLIAGSGNHTISYTYQYPGGQPTTATSIFTVHPLPVIDLGADTLICMDQSITLHAPVIGLSNVLWLPFNTTAQSITFDSTGFGVVPVTVILIGWDTNGCSSRDTIVVDIQDCSGIGNPDSLLCRAFPNPSNGEFSIEISQGINTEYWISIYDLLGRAVWADRVTHNTQTVVKPGIGLSKGEYLILISNGEDKRVCRLVIAE